MYSRNVENLEPQYDYGKALATLESKFENI
jgi:hypothetical protein